MAWQEQYSNPDACRVRTESFGDVPKPFPAPRYITGMSAQDWADVVRDGLLYLGKYSEEQIVEWVLAGHLRNGKEIEELTHWAEKDKT